MKAADFLYHRAETVEAAIRYLDDYGGGARVLAGGQSLVPMLNMRLWRPAALIDVNSIESLSGIRSTPDETILGATVRHATIETSRDIAGHLPLLATMIRCVGDRQIRNRGTLGGSLVQADPSAELPLACCVLGAKVRAEGPRGVRDIAMADFLQGAYATSLDPCELVTCISFPKHPPQFAFREVCRRHNDFAVVAVAATGTRDPTGRWRNVRLGLGGVNDVPLLAAAAMQILEATRLEDVEIEAAADAAQDCASPVSDMRASDTYRRHLLRVYVRRVLNDLRDIAEH